MAVADEVSVTPCDHSDTIVVVFSSSSLPSDYHQLSKQHSITHSILDFLFTYLLFLFFVFILIFSFSSSRCSAPIPFTDGRKRGVVVICVTVVWLCLPLFAVRPVCDVLSSLICCCCGCVFAIHTEQHWRRPGILPPFSVDWTDLPSFPHKKFVVVVVLLLFYDVYDDWRCHTSCLFRLCVYLFLGMLLRKCDVPVSISWWQETRDTAEKEYNGQEKQMGRLPKKEVANSL